MDERRHGCEPVFTLPGVLLAYLDESYDAHHYWMAALVCPEHTVAPLTAALDHVVEQAARSYRGVSPRAELHGHDLMHAKHDWGALRHMPRARIGVYQQALRAIGDLDVEIIVRGVRISRLRTRYGDGRHPHAVVLEHLLERIDECSETRHANEAVLVIADQVSGEDGYRQGLRYFQRHATSGYRSRRLTRIVDILHFAPSGASRLVQAADLVVYLHRRLDSGQVVDPRAVRANAMLWGHVARRVIHSHCWYP